MKWLWFSGSAVVAAMMLVWYGAPVAPVIAGASLASVWKLICRD